MSAKRPSLKGKGAQIFLGDEPAEENESRKNVYEVAEKLQTQKSSKPKASKTEASEAEVAQKVAEPVSATAVVPEKIEKEKATFYLPVDVLEDLENVWHDVRRLTHRKIKKSEIVAIALQSTADEFKAWQNEERKRSRLVDRLSK